MRKFRVLALMLATILLVGMCSVGCTSNNDITVTLEFWTSEDAEAAWWKQEIKVNAEAPTVELVVNEASAEYPDLGCTWSDRYELSLPDYPDTQLEDGTYMFWTFTIDGVEATAKANEASVTDGSVIKYVYTALNLEDTAAE
ncbi:MAG: hypothetical protein IJ449_10645 [Clostridia bacterium]|nr:hypothetical protein [Clostridia bacterium]